MEGVRKFFSSVAGFFGLRRNSKYVNDYIHKANMRSGIYLSAVVIILEIWLVCRQHQKYVIPQTLNGENYFVSLFNNTSLFWLLMVLSIAMLIYCAFYLSSKKKKPAMIAVLVPAGIGLILCCLLPFESSIANYDEAKIVETTLLITMYLTIATFLIILSIATITLYKGKTMHWLTSMTVISFFAACLLIFGVRVSYKDFFSSTEEKQIMCFLTMSVYVACLLVWKPYISVSVIGVIFLAFYFLLKSNYSVRVLPDGDKINYITFFISLAMVSVSIHTQRSLEARKDEELELLATKDKLTGLYAFEYFMNLCQKKIIEEKIQPGEYVYLFIDITSFSLYNEQKGFTRGNQFLVEVGNILRESFPGSLLCRQGDDNFVIFEKNIDIESKLDAAKHRVEILDADIKPSIKAGGYLFKSKEDDPHVAVERARATAGIAKSRPNETYLVYDEKLREKTRLVRYIVSHVDEAIEKGWIKAYYQPVVYASDRKLCGAEALTRWIDPTFGFMSPGLFINTLESAQLVYKLDLAMMEIVCKNMAELKRNGKPIVPVSINFSRADFSIIDVPAEVKKIADKYGIDPKYLHVEITESALLGENVDLKSAMDRLKENGFEIWLDDFGSGYSSLNALKDYAFDTMKLDMEFLRGFETNKKSKPLINAVIHMAKRIGMATLAEGVETEGQAAFLDSIGCEKLQGYLISKPIPHDDFVQAIDDGKFVVSEAATR